MFLKKLTKKNKIRLIIASVALLLLILAIFALDMRLKTVHYKIESDKVENRVRIALVTDLHSCKYGKDQKKLINALEKQNPDVVLLGGDIFDDEHSDDNTEKFISAVAGKYPCYYVTGNHEFLCSDESFLKKMNFLVENGVTILKGNAETIEINGEKINICGIDDPSVRVVDGYNNFIGGDFTVVGEDDSKWLDRLDLLDEIAQNGNYTLLLTHRPEKFEEYAQYDFDLVLSGHVHGGQWRIPWLINGLYSPSEGFFPDYTGGKYEKGTMTMIVSRGLAIETTIVPRIFNRPELVIIDIEQKFTVEGMSCVNCSAAVERAVKKLDGTENVEVSLLTKSMTCEFDEKKLSAKKIINAVNKAGYRCSLYGEKSENRSKFLSEKTRLISSSIILLPLVYISMGEMIGLPTPHFLHQYPLISAIIQLILALAVAAINAKFFVNGFKSLAKLSPNMDSLVAMGSSASFLYGIFSIIMLSVGISQNNSEFIDKYSHGLYFESAAMILTLVTVGKMLEERAKTKTGSAIAKLSRLAPERSTVIRDGREVEIPSREIVKGDIVVIRPGQSVPVDGVIIEGHSEINEASLTGESEPRFKTVGDEVMTATVNLTGAFKMEAKKVGGETVLAKIIELVENTSASKAPVARLADKVAGVFVPIVTSIALVTAIIWLVADYPFDFALSNAISVLVISCPCALGLATPVAITVAVGKCASEGILIKSAEALETLHKTNVAVFDKTGTLTKGHPAVNDAVAIGCDEKELLSIALSLENSSEHPLARAVCQYAISKGAVLSESTDFAAVGGKGVNADIKNRRYYAGNAAYMDELGVDISAWNEKVQSISEEGNTVMFFTDGEKLLGFIAAADEINEDAPKALKMLDTLGVETVMLTGDNELSARATAKKLGINSIISGVLPSEKGNTVKALCESGKTVIMTGDGINDAPALIAADVGIAVGAGTDIAIDSADIVLVKNSLTDIAETIKYSRRVMTNIKENLFWAFFYNAICIPIAAGALYPLWQITLSPMLASAAMSLSSIFVVTNALRLYKK